MQYHIEELISKEQVDKRVCELARQINQDYEGKELHLIIILKGSVFFGSELAKRITVPLTMDFMSVSSYGDGMESVGTITVKKELDEELIPAPKRGPGRPKGSKNRKTLEREAKQQAAEPLPKRKPGRPKGSKNKPKITVPKRGRGRPRKDKTM